MPYEEGMQVVFEMVERTAVVSFRDKIKILGPFTDYKAAIKAGEQYCRDHGWDNGDVRTEITLDAARSGTRPSK